VSTRSATSEPGAEEPPRRPGLSCVYCAGHHESASEVRACWERSRASALPGLLTPETEAEAGRGDEPDESRSRQRVGSAIPRPARPPEDQGRAGGHTDRGPARRERPENPADIWLGAPPPLLGRSVVIGPGQEPPAAWRQCDRATEGLEELEAAWRERRPLVITLEEDQPFGEPSRRGSAPREAAEDEVENRPVWSLSPGFAFSSERRIHASFANAIDARAACLRWPLAEEAIGLGARAATSGGDVILPDNSLAYCDGGPLGWLGPIDGVPVIPRIALASGSLIPFGVNRTDATLAPDQLAAVLHEGGAARIIAPAGSGKTRVLTERARHLLRAWHLPARALTLVAFNKRAAEEMVERTADLAELDVRTLNSLGLQIISSSERVATIDEAAVRSILDSLVDLPHRANTDPAAAWIEALSAVRLGLRPPAVVEAEFGGDVDGLREVFEAYRQVLGARHLVDFDEQIYRAIEILLVDPAARRRARGAGRVLLVDEFQDLTPAHLLLIRLLAGPEGAVFGVGDDDQTIYGYSGASPEWLIDYRSYFRTAGSHCLEVNYRCPVRVVEAARTLLTHNGRRVEKLIVAAPDRLSSEEELEVRTEQDELGATLETVAGLIATGVGPAEIAVLSRVNVSLAPVQVGLVHAQIPVRPAIDLSYLSRNGVQAALGWLRLAVAEDGRLSASDLALAARRPSRALSPKVVEWIAEQHGMSGLRKLAGRLKARDRDKVLDFVAGLEAVRGAARSGSTVAVLGAVRDEIGLGRAMELLEASRRRLDRSAQTDDLAALLALGALHPEPEGFEAWLRESLSEPGSKNGVVLSSIHRVKGREWPHVILHGVSTGLMPHRLAEDVEEERRIFHVGLTRGSETVHVVAGMPASPFLAELFEPAGAIAPSQDQPPALGPTRRSTGPRHRVVSRSAPSEPAVVAVVGLVFDHGGHRYTVRSVGEDSVTATLGRATVHLRYGELVSLEGRLSRLCRPSPSPEVIDRVREALRSWRADRARAEAKPAYVYLSDRTLEALCTAQPSSLAALASVKGIGPSKLDAYGEELLALIAHSSGEAESG